MNSLKRYRVGRRELPFSVIRRAVAKHESLDCADWEPDSWEYEAEDAAQEEHWMTTGCYRWPRCEGIHCFVFQSCGDNCGCCTGDEVWS